MMSTSDRNAPPTAATRRVGLGGLILTVVLAGGLTSAPAAAVAPEGETAAREAFTVVEDALATEDLELRARSAPLYRKAIELFTLAIACDDPEATRMAELHSGRGLLRHLLGDDRAAIADYSRAIEFDGRNDVYYERRAISRIFLGDFRQAVADLTRAIELDGSQVMPYTGRRGFAHFYAGEFAAAEEDFASAIELGDPRVHIPIWRHIAAARASGGDLSTIRSFNAYDPTVWPGPVVELLKGQASVEEVLDETARADPVATRNLRTEALFYIGQYHLINDRPGDAKVAFQQLLKLGDRFFAEYVGARVELDQLAQ